jgi:hypothetical protein
MSLHGADVRTVGDNRLSLWLTFAVLLCAVLYGLLVAGDYALAKYRSYLGKTIVSEPGRIEDKRVDEEDLPQRDIAIAQGFKTELYPDAVDMYPALADLARKLGVAPLAPQPRTRLIHGNEGYGMVTYTTDRFGFRNADGLWDEKSIDLVLIGDSFTHGCCVRDGESFAASLASQLKVLNLGTASNHPIHYAALAKIFVRHIKPKFVALVFYANDNGAGDQRSIFYEQYFLNEVPYFDPASTDRLDLSDGLKRFYAESGPIVQELLDEDAPVAEPRGFFERGNILVRAKPYLSLTNVRFELSRLTAMPRLIPGPAFSSKLAIDTLIEACRSSGCRPIVVYIPNSEFWRPDAYAASYARSLAAYSKERGLRFVDTTDALRAIGEASYAPKGPHLSPEGNRRVASAILAALADG